MLTFTRPTDRMLAELVEHAHGTELSYCSGLLHRCGAERGWFVDRHRAQVGHGLEHYAAACEAIRKWVKFQQPWTMPALPAAPIEIGATVGYSARVLGVWWSYCCRIVDVIDEVTPDGSRSFGLDYGTVRGHAERGEERFLVTYDAASGDVHFSLFAMSRPGRWYTWLGLPIARRAQARFRPGSAAAMRRFIEGQCAGAGEAESDLMSDLSGGTAR